MSVAYVFKNYWTDFDENFRDCFQRYYHNCFESNLNQVKNIQSSKSNQQLVVGTLIRRIISQSQVRRHRRRFAIDLRYTKTEIHLV